MGCRALLQGIFPTQGSNPCLFHLTCTVRHHLGSPHKCITIKLQIVVNAIREIGRCETEPNEILESSGSRKDSWKFKPKVKGRKGPKVGTKELQKGHGVREGSECGGGPGDRRTQAEAGRGEIMQGLGFHGQGPAFHPSWGKGQSWQDFK